MQPKVRADGLVHGLQLGYLGFLAPNWTISKAVLLLSIVYHELMLLTSYLSDDLTVRAGFFSFFF